MSSSSSSSAHPAGRPASQPAGGPVDRDEEMVDAFVASQQARRALGRILLRIGCYGYWLTEIRSLLDFGKTDRQEAIPYL